MAKIDQVKKGVDELRERLLVKEPEHFSAKDIVRAFFGALLLGLTFSVKGLLIRVSQALDNTHMILIAVSTLLILTAEIYYIGYKRVTKKSERKFGQFWIKRLLVFYLVAILVSVSLVYVVGFDKPVDGNILNLILLYTGIFTTRHVHFDFLLKKALSFSLESKSSKMYCY